MESFQLCRQFPKSQAQRSGTNRIGLILSFDQPLDFGIGSISAYYCMASSTIAFPSMCCLPDHCVVLAERAIWCWLGIARIGAWGVGGGHFNFHIPSVLLGRVLRAL